MGQKMFLGHKNDKEAVVCRLIQRMFTKQTPKTLYDFFLSLVLKVRREGASLTSEFNWFQSLGPRNEIDSCPFDILKRGTRKSASVPLSLLVVRAEFSTNSSVGESKENPRLKGDGSLNIKAMISKTVLANSFS